MDLLENIAEYYDELFPASDELKKFYEEESSSFAPPVKYLSIGAGTGTFEHYLAKNGADVTGLETVLPLLESASRKRRTQIMSLRFFQMSALEMCRFLGKNFYNIISIPDWRIIFTHDPTLLSKLFYDCKQLLANDGKLIIQMPNFQKFSDSDSKSAITLPVKKSLRVSLCSKILTDSNSNKILAQDLETGSGKLLAVTRDAKVMTLTSSQIEDYARKAGFSSISFYSDFSKAEFTADSDELIAVIR